MQVRTDYIEEVRKHNLVEQATKVAEYAKREYMRGLALASYCDFDFFEKNCTITITSKDVEDYLKSKGVSSEVEPIRKRWYHYIFGFDKKKYYYLDLLKKVPE